MNLSVKKLQTTYLLVPESHLSPRIPRDVHSTEEESRIFRMGLLLLLGRMLMMVTMMVMMMVVMVVVMTSGWLMMMQPSSTPTIATSGSCTAIAGGCSSSSGRCSNRRTIADEFLLHSLVVLFVDDVINRITVN